VAKVTRELLFAHQMDVPPCDRRIANNRMVRQSGICFVIAALSRPGALRWRIPAHAKIHCGGGALGHGGVQGAPALDSLRGLFGECFHHREGAACRAWRRSRSRVRGVIYAMLMAVHDALSTLRSEFSRRLRR